MFGFKTNKQTSRETQEKNAVKPGFFTRLKKGLSRTRQKFTDGLASLLLNRKQIDAEVLEELETLLLMADVGVEATQDIIDDLTTKIDKQQMKEPAALVNALQENMLRLLAPAERPLILDDTQKPFVILMVGVNGVGKTTTIGKLAQLFLSENKSVMLAAGDTFRAAAVEQLQAWGDRNNVPVIAQHSGADAAAVIFDALQAAQARNIDVLIADTAGRLHTQSNLMEELKKIKRVMGKLDTQAPHEVMLVLDAGTGQNALSQAKQFSDTVNLTGITLTKLDGTAKGGIIFSIAKQLGIPIRFIGVGENIEDLRPFNAEEFINALLLLPDNPDLTTSTEP